MDQNNLHTDAAAAGMDAEPGRIFRKATRGYNRDDVAAYIERMSRDRRRDAERYSAHIRSLEEHLETATSETARLRAETVEAKSEAMAAQSRAEESAAELAVITGKNDKLRRQAAELNEKLAAANADGGKIDELRAELRRSEDEIERLRAELSAREYRRPAPSGAEAPRRRTLFGSEIVRSRTHGDAELRTKLERARIGIRDSIYECSAQSDELRLKLEQLEDLLRE
jgi:DNA repair exonuclease SbcCD ATPase subunit